MPTYLTYREAGKRVRRSVKTVKRWRRHGMSMGWDNRQGQRVRVVDEDTLLDWWRSRLNADPVHQARLRAQALQRAEAHQLVHKLPTN